MIVIRSEYLFIDYDGNGRKSPDSILVLAAGPKLFPSEAGAIRPARLREVVTRRARRHQLLAPANRARRCLRSASNLRVHEPLHHPQITFESRGIHSLSAPLIGKNHFADSAMMLSLLQKNRKVTMIKKLLGAAAVAAFALAIVPAQAAKVRGVGCSGPNLEKTETAVEAMADGDSKWSAEKEMAAAQDSLLGGKMGACGAHLSKAMHATTAK
jgi:hypothetical protein